MDKLDHIIATALLVSIAIFAPQAGAVTQTVDCDRGQTIQSALDKKQRSSEQLVINVSGTCEENVSITRDDVTINGGHITTIRGTVYAEGANRIFINHMTITGPGNGFVAYGGRTELSGVTITQNELDGLWAIQNSIVRMSNSTVSENGLSGAFIQTSKVELSNSDFINNNSDGILLDIGANAISWGSKFTGNLRNGITVRLHSVTQIRDATVVSGNSQTGAVIMEDSALRIDTSDVIFPDEIWCADDESSLGNDGGVSTGYSTCTDFNQVAPTP